MRQSVWSSASTVLSCSWHVVKVAGCELRGLVGCLNLDGPVNERLTCSLMCCRGRRNRQAKHEAGVQLSNCLKDPAQVCSVFVNCFVKSDVVFKVVKRAFVLSRRAGVPIFLCALLNHVVCQQVQPRSGIVDSTPLMADLDHSVMVLGLNVLKPVISVVLGFRI